MNKYLTIITSVVLILILGSCNQDLLDIEQHGALNMENYYSEAKDDDALSLSADIYAYTFFIKDPVWYTFLNGLSDDGMMTGEVYSNINVNSSNHPGNSYFSMFYRVNYMCNLIIEKLPKDSEIKNQVVGEAYFWRAWSYLNLIRLWGNPPLVDHVLGKDELRPVNADTDELWNYVEMSLEEAIDLLPEKPGLGGQSSIGGRVTKQAAYALLGKAQLIKGDYANSMTNLNTVINSGKFELIEDFTQLYHVAADFCDEYVWEWNIDDNNQAAYEKEGDFRVLSLTWESSRVTVPGGLEQGWGGADLNKEFYDFMVARGEKGKSRYLGTLWDYDDVLQRFIDLGLASEKDEAQDMFWKEQAVMPFCQGYFRSKMLPWAGETFEYTPGSDIRGRMNWPGMRYSEVLLLFAEACIQSGSNLEQGLSALNEVRKRAGLSSLTSYTLQDLKDEKRAELAYEGERYLDLIRWGDAPVSLAQRGFKNHTFYGYTDGSTDYNVSTLDVVGAQGFQLNRDELFPYPYSETLINENLVQNPGW